MSLHHIVGTEAFDYADHRFGPAYGAVRVMPMRRVRRGGAVNWRVVLWVALAALGAVALLARCSPCFRPALSAAAAAARGTPRFAPPRFGRRGRVGSSVVEHSTFNRMVLGSNPSQPTISAHPSGGRRVAHA